jgi:Flp pilus assembly protein TadD
MGAIRKPRQPLILAAEGYLELGMHEHALAALDRLGDPTSLETRATYLKGEALRALGRFGESLIELQRAAEASPDDIHIWLAMGWCYKRTGRIHMAIQALEEALTVEPGDALIHYNLACYWCLAGNKPRALKYLADTFRIDANYRDLVDAERDFDAIRNDPEFLSLMTVNV